MLKMQELAILTSLVTTNITEVYSAVIMRDTLKLFVIEHESDLSSYAVAYNCDEKDILLAIHEVEAVEFGVELFSTFREAKDFFNGRVSL